MNNKNNFKKAIFAKGLFKLYLGVENATIQKI